MSGFKRGRGRRQRGRTASPAVRRYRPECEFLESRLAPACTPYFDPKGAALYVFCEGPGDAVLRTDGDGNILLNDEPIAGDPTVANTTGIEVTGSDDPNTLDVSAMAGFGGAVFLYGLSGNDRLIAGDGDDWLYGGDGDDFLDGGAGRDILAGEVGRDTLWGGAGSDYLDGGDDNDSLLGQEGTDSLWGSAGNDSLYGGAGMDYLNGGDGDDALYGEAGHDDVYGGVGSDSLFGGSEIDHLNGDGGGADRYDFGDPRTSGFVSYGGAIRLATTWPAFDRENLFTLLYSPDLIRTTFNDAWVRARPGVTQELITALSRLQPPVGRRFYDITLNLTPSADFQITNQNDITSVKFLLRHNTSQVHNRLGFCIDIPILPDPCYYAWFDAQITGAVARTGPVRLEGLTASVTVPRIDNRNTAASVYRAIIEFFTGDSLRTMIEREINNSTFLRDALRAGIQALNDLLQEVFPLGEDLTMAFDVPSNTIIIRVPSFGNPSGPAGGSFPPLFRASDLFGDPLLSDPEGGSPLFMPLGTRARKVRG